MDRNKIAALLESLCERPFAGDPDTVRPQDIAHRAAQALSKGQGPNAGSDAAADPGAQPDVGSPAELAAILSGTATAAQCDAFLEAAATSRAVRLEAQSALAFVDGIEQAPQMAPAHLVQEVLASAPPAPAPAFAKSRPSLWAHIMPRRQVAATLAVLVVGGGLSWSLLWRDTGYESQTSPVSPVVPVSAGPEEERVRAFSPAPMAPIMVAPSDKAPVVASPPAPAGRALLAPGSRFNHGV